MNQSEIAIVRIRNRILEGEIGPGVRLKEAELCRELGLSRTPIREALRRLATEGLVTISPNRGARVVRLSKSDLSYLYDMLFAIECAASRLACAVIAPEQIEKLIEYQAWFAQGIKDRNYPHLRQVNYQFHKLITEATGNPYLLQSWTNLRMLWSRLSNLMLSPQFPEIVKASFEEHAEIIRSFREKNPAAAEFAMRSHLETGKKLIFDYLDRLEDRP